MTIKEPSIAPVVLITGAAQRIGAVIARTLHTEGYNVVLHYLNSQNAAQVLCAELNALRQQSAISLSADLNDVCAIQQLAHNAIQQWQRMDALVNNASTFFPTSVGSATVAQWDNLMGSNARAPFFLAQALASQLAEQRGVIVNIADIYADRPLAQHTLYCMAKAANVMLTKSLAKELAPQVRVNGIAPGAILWPEQGGAVSAGAQTALLEKVPMQCSGMPEDIANTVLFLLRDAPYITGQIIAVDGGRSINV
jgi:pteridine reductase